MYGNLTDFKYEIEQNWTDLLQLKIACLCNSSITNPILSLERIENTTSDLQCKNAKSYFKTSHRIILVLLFQ